MPLDTVETMSKSAIGSRLGQNQIEVELPHDAQKRKSGDVQVSLGRRSVAAGIEELRFAGENIEQGTSPQLAYPVVPALETQRQYLPDCGEIQPFLEL